MACHVRVSDVRWVDMACHVSTCGLKCQASTAPVLPSPLLKSPLMLRVGFLGCGAIAGSRARSLRALNELTSEPIFECVAACDLAPSKGAAFVARWGGQFYSSVGRMLGDAELDALFVGTPPSARGSGENAALSAGVALWIEPPVAATIRTANALALAIKKSALPVMVASPQRYSPELERLRRVLTAKNAPQLWLWQGTFGASLKRVAWRSEAKNGNVWLEGAWPMLDLLRFLGLEAAGAHAKSNGEAGAASLQTRGGALVSLGVSRFGTAREHLEANGDDVFLSLSNWSSAPRVELSTQSETTIWRGDDPVHQQLEAFARLLRTGKRTENRSTFADAVETLKMALELN